MDDLVICLSLVALQEGMVITKAKAINYLVGHFCVTKIGGFP